MRRVFSLAQLVVLTAVFCIGFTVTANAQLAEDTIFESEFRIDKWKKNKVRQGRVVGVTVFFGKQPFLHNFTYKGTSYNIWGVSSSYLSAEKKVHIGISPRFPPEGSDRKLFNIYVGSKGGDLKKFNFGDTTNNEWPGEAGFKNVTTGTVKITVIDESLGDNLEFATFLPAPSLIKVDGSDITHKRGRIQIRHGDKAYAICNTGFGREEAQVACRQLGSLAVGASVSPLTQDDFKNTDTSNTTWSSWKHFFSMIALLGTPVLLDQVECTGNESRLVDCNHLGLGVVSGGFCPAINFAAVNCIESVEDANNNCICGRDPNTGQCWSRQHCGEGGGFGE